MMGRKRDIIQKHTECVRFTEESIEIIEMIQSLSAKWTIRLTNKSKVIIFALEFMKKNLEQIDSLMKKPVDNA
jgi:hypothetical protein